MFDLWFWDLIVISSLEPDDIELKGNPENQLMWMKCKPCTNREFSNWNLEWR